MKSKDALIKTQSEVDSQVKTHIDDDTQQVTGESTTVQNTQSKVITNFETVTTQLIDTDTTTSATDTSAALTVTSTTETAET